MNRSFWLTFVWIFLVGITFPACSSEENEEPDNLPPLDQTIIWSGPTLSFEKADGADQEDPTNQDRITNRVWITRRNNGQIYNAAQEGLADKETSPEGTLWAIGTTVDLQNLTFDTFRGTLDKPRNAVGTNLVLLLIEENVAIDLTLTSWSSNGAGGFAYDRSTN
ncbi:MAG: hypothetical protein AAFV80_09970 [Bacteroidota bacterium]